MPYPVAVPPQRSQRLTALVPTGRYVSNANDYEHGSYSASPRDSRLVLARRSSLAKMDRKTTRRIGYGSAAAGAAGTAGIVGYAGHRIWPHAMAGAVASTDNAEQHYRRTGQVLSSEERDRWRRQSPEYRRMLDEGARLTRRTKHPLAALGALTVSGLATGLTNRGDEHASKAFVGKSLGSIYADRGSRSVQKLDSSDAETRRLKRNRNIGYGVALGGLGTGLGILGADYMELGSRGRAAAERFERLKGVGVLGASAALGAGAFYGDVHAVRLARHRQMLAMHRSISENLAPLIAASRNNSAGR
jgi:hypothetical protein